MPRIGELGMPAPIRLDEFMERIAENERASRIMQIITAADELGRVDGSLLAQQGSAGPLSQWVSRLLQSCGLLSSSEDPDVVFGAMAGVDDIWAAFFDRAMAAAKRFGSSFLSSWVLFEISLRNALAAARAAKIGRSYQGVGTSDLIDLTDEDVAKTMADWVAATSAISEALAIERGRWKWLLSNDAWFSFNDDEVVAYGTKLIGLERWQRLTSVA